MERLRVGIIGTGFGTVIQAPGFMAHPAYELVALSGVARPGRAAEQAAKLGIPRAYDDWQLMLKEEALDVVSIVSAPYLHAPMTIVMTGDKELLAGRPGEPLQPVELPKQYRVAGAQYTDETSDQLAAFITLADNLAHAIRGTRPQNESPESATFEDGAAVQAILDAVRRSFKEQAWIKL